MAFKGEDSQTKPKVVQQVLSDTSGDHAPRHAGYFRSTMKITGMSRTRFKRDFNLGMMNTSAASHFSHVMSIRTIGIEVTQFYISPSPLLPEMSAND
jgi:hypothetical protein